MGVLYTMVSYLSGNKNTQNKVTEIKVITTTTKLIKHLRLKQQRIQQQTKKIQADIIKSVGGLKGTRSIHGQNQLFQQIIKNGELFAAYQELIRCSNVIKNQARVIQNRPNEISKQCLIALCTILYSYEHLHIQQHFKLGDLLPEPYPSIDVGHISIPLRSYVNNKEPSLYEINMYVLQMCERHGTNIEMINECGHQFVYNPSQDYITKSSQMFAMSFQNDQAMEQQVQKRIEAVEN